MKMRKIFFVLAFIVSTITVRAQLITKSQSDTFTNMVFRGVLTSGLGLGNAIYTDTSAANASSRGIKNIVGIQIFTTSDNSFWVRNAAADGWVSASSADVAAGWCLLGNAGTNSGINYLGTTDSVSLNIITNNIIRIFIDSLGNVNIILGSTNIGGGISHEGTGTITNGDADITLTPSNNLVDFNVALSSKRNVLLPPSANCRQGQEFIIKSSGAAGGFDIQILPDGTDTIDLLASYSISTILGAVTIYLVGTDWVIVNVKI